MDRVSVKCAFCSENGPLADDMFEAAETACEQEFGFVKLSFPNQRNFGKTLTRFLCKLCAKHTSTYFVGKLSEEVLIPLGEDIAFESDDDY